MATARMREDPQRTRQAREMAESIVAGARPDRLNAVLERCGEDSDLVALVLSELNEIETPTANGAGAESGPPPNARIGPFRLLYPIDRGGYGMVYAAVRSELNPPTQLAAIKLIGPGRTEDAVRLFHYEREILARLSHSYIVRLYDSGESPSWGPYFAMELVSGITVTGFCDEHALTVRQRLELFLKFCEAVCHLHRHSIVHRDLKPGNMLVDRDGNPKLIDFGIAVLLEPRQMGLLPLDDRGRRRLTPEFAAPELRNGGWIRETADVYALGAVLFLLLTGRSPECLGRDEDEDGDESSRMNRASSLIASAQPANCGESNVASLRRRLRGDLDAIIARAMSVRPACRYNTALDLAEDIRRHMRLDPVEARRSEGWLYRFSRPLSRNPAAAIAVCALLVSLLAGVVFSVSQWRAAVEAKRQADRERSFAQERLQTVRALATDVEGHLAYAGSETRRSNAEFYDDLAKVFEDFGDRQPGQKGMAFGTALKLREVARREWIAAGDRLRADAALKRIGVLEDKTVRGGRVLDVPVLPASTVALAGSYNALGQLLGAAGDLPGARKAWQNCANIAAELPKNGPDTAAREALALDCRRQAAAQ
jgi:serine/threonine-protein kinase